MSMLALKMGLPWVALLLRRIFVLRMAKVEEFPFCEPIWRE